MKIPTQTSWPNCRNPKCSEMQVIFQFSGTMCVLPPYRACPVSLKEGMLSNDGVLSKQRLCFWVRDSSSLPIWMWWTSSQRMSTPVTHGCRCDAAGETESCLLHFAVTMWPAISQASHGPTLSSAQRLDELVA